MDLLMETACILLLTLQASKVFSSYGSSGSANFEDLKTSTTTEPFAYSELVNYTSVSEMENSNQSMLQKPGAETWLKNDTSHDQSTIMNDMPLRPNTTINGTHFNLNTTITDTPLDLNTNGTDMPLTSNVTVTNTPINNNTTATNTTTFNTNTTSTATPLYTTDNETKNSQAPTLSPTVPGGYSTLVMTTDLNFTSDNSSVGNERDRGLMAEVKKKKVVVWGAVIGVAIAVGFVGFIVYNIRRSRSQEGFSHRKLIEDTPTEPVLRLDNGEPLNLQMDGMAYYNPGLSGENIQMTNFT